MGLFTSSIQGGKLSFAYAPRGDSQRRHSERSEESPPFMFWVEFEEGHFPSSNIGDPSQSRLGVTFYPVVSSEARDLLFNRKGKQTPFRTDTKCRPERLL